MSFLLKLVIPILLITSVAFAGQEKPVRYGERADVNEIYKRAFESAQASYKHQRGLQQTGVVKTQPLTLKTSEVVTIKTSSWIQIVKSYIVAKFQVLWRQTKKMTAFVYQGEKDAPTGALYYEQWTSGPNPVFYIGFDFIDGDVDHFVWDFGDGSTYTMPYSDFNENLYGVSHMYQASGTYTVTVSLFNSLGESSDATVDVVVQNTNKLPFTRLTVKPGQVANSVVFNMATVDEDRTLPGGAGTMYSLKFGDNQRFDSADNSVTHTYGAAGNYLVKLGTYDEYGGVSNLRTTIYVGTAAPAGGSVPIAAPKIVQTSSSAPYTVEFDANSSFDLEGPIASYEWNFGDFGSFTNISTDTKVTYDYKRPGTYFGYLKVTDAGGLSTTRYFPIYVMPIGTTTPEIVAYPTGSPLEISFDGNQNALKSIFDNDYIVWDFGDGETERGSYPIHTYASAGTYTVTLKIYDQLGVYKEVQKDIVVGTSMTAPTAQFHSNTVNEAVNTWIYFETTNPTAVDPDTTVTWDFGDGTVATGLHKDHLTFAHGYTQKGLYLVTLTATNINGISNKWQMNVAISDEDSIVADMQLSTKSGKLPFPIRMDASGSTSQVGTIKNYTWAIYSPEGERRLSGKTVSTTFENTPGYRDIVLRVKDSAGNEAFAFDRVMALDPAGAPPGNNPPVPQITISFPNSSDPEWFGFNSSGSTDPESDQLVQYEWMLDGKTIIGDQPAIYNRITADGKHRVTLRITDIWGNVGEATKYFEKTTHTDVTFDFLYGPLTPVTNDTIFFVAENVVLPGKAIKEKIWDFGDGNRDCCQNSVSHVYVSAGSYTVKLILKDYDGNSYEKTKTIVVADPAPPSVVITARDDMDLVSQDSGGTYTASVLPAKVVFDLNKTDSQGLLKDAVWDFGDGNTGFGLNPSWTYYKTGSYTVQVTATDEHGQSNTSTIIVEVTSDACPDSDGYTGCLVLDIGNTRILPMSSTSWTLNHDRGAFDFISAPTDPSWVHLERIEYVSGDDPANPSTRVTNIGDTVTVGGDSLVVDKALVAAKGIDLTKSYKLTVSSSLTDGTDETSYYAEEKAIYFGIGTLNITANEQGIRFLIIGAKSGYKKYVSLGTSTSHTLNDLPADTYIVSAEKDSRQHTYNFEITSSAAASLSIDLSVANLRKLEIERSNEAKTRKYFSPAALLKGLEKTRVASDKSIQAFRKRMNYVLDDSIPSWAYDWCGNAPPYPLSPNDRVAPAGKEFTREFSSSNPQAQNNFFPVTDDYGPKIKLSCLLANGSTNYSENYWKFVDGRDRCWNGTPPRPSIDPYWENFLAQIGHHDTPYAVTYEIKDGVTGKIVTRTVRTSAAEHRGEWGIGLDSITSKIGLATTGHTTEHGYRKTWEIEVPKGIQLPQIKFSLDSIHDEATSDSYYMVACDLERRTDLESAVTMVKPDSSSVSISRKLDHGPKENGLRLLKNGFLPLSADNSGTSPKNKGFPDIFKASLDIVVYKGNWATSQINQVQADISYGTSTNTFVYDLHDKIDGYLGNNNYFVARIEIDASAFNGLYTYVPLVSHVDVKFRPKLPDGSLGNPYTKTWRPMIDVKGPYIAQTPCNHGFYSGRISAYAVPEMIEALKVQRTNGFNFRCNDFSLPWGGEFRLVVDALPNEPDPDKKNWKHAEHKNGRVADVRYANLDIAAADASDETQYGIAAFGRVNDVTTYLNFVKEARLIAESSNPDYIDMKDNILEYCVDHPTADPCRTGLTRPDIDKDFVVNFCQWRQSAEGQIDGCPLLSESDYIGVVLRYSIWTRMNIDRNYKMQSSFEFIISDGSHIDLGTFSPLTINKKWQTAALQGGLWPDNSPIYEVQLNSVISKNKVVACSPSPCSSKFILPKDENEHYHHTHYRLK